MTEPKEPTQKEMDLALADSLTEKGWKGHIREFDAIRRLIEKIEKMRGWIFDEWGNEADDIEGIKSGDFFGETGSEIDVAVKIIQELVGLGKEADDEWDQK